jgi:hypothetical protein
MLGALVKIACPEPPMLPVVVIVSVWAVSTEEFVAVIDPLVPFDKPIVPVAPALTAALITMPPAPERVIAGVVPLPVIAPPIVRAPVLEVAVILLPVSGPVDTVVPLTLIVVAWIEPLTPNVTVPPEFTVMLVAVPLPSAPLIAMPLEAAVDRLIVPAAMGLLFIVMPVPLEAESARVKVVAAAPVTVAP